MPILLDVVGLMTHKACAEKLNSVRYATVPKILKNNHSTLTFLSILLLFIRSICVSSL